MVPTKIVTFRRWEIAVAFVVLSVAFTVMGILLNNQNSKLQRHNVILHQQIKKNTKAIKLIQASRVEACKQNYKDVQGIISLFIQEQRDENHGKLPREDTLTILRYYRTHPMDCTFRSTR